MVTEKELAKLIADVELEFTAHLAKAESAHSQVLAKAEGSEEEKEHEEKEQSPSNEPAPEAEADKDGEEHEADKEEKAPEHKEEQKDGEEKDAEEHGSQEYSDEDMDKLHSMYGSMSKHELAAHHSSILRHLEKPSKEEEKAPEAPAQEAAAPEAPMEKSEKIEISLETLPTPDSETVLLKSEIEAQKAKTEELQKNLDAVTAFVTALVKKTVPKGKSITSLDVIAKSESPKEEINLSKSEITAILTQKASQSTLAKSDRDAINSFYSSGSTNVNSISHLLK